MKDILMTEMGGDKIVIFTSKITHMIEKSNNGGTNIYMLEWEDPLYSKLSIAEILMKIEAER